MTDEEINITIAETRGWKFPKIKRYICGETFKVVRPDGTSFDLWRGEVYCTNTSRSGVDFNEFPFRSIEEICSHAGFPDYLNDLNAMHEVLKSIPCDLWDTFESNLGWITGDRGFCKITATARQLAEAFLKTLNRWKA